MSTNSVYVNIDMTEDQALALLDHIADPKQTPEILHAVFAQLKQEIEGSLAYNAHCIPGTLTRIKPH